MEVQTPEQGAEKPKNHKQANISPLRYGLAWLKLSFFLFAGIYFAAVPINHFDEGESVCLSVVFFDMECYACGMTSALKHLLHFDFELAFAYNMASFLVFPILGLLWLGWIVVELQTIRRFHRQKITPSRAE